MQKSKIENQVMNVMHGLPLEEQQSILEFSLNIKNKIKISHFVKVREGCGFGGNKKSISIAYAFLSNFKTKYLLVEENGINYT